MRRLLAAACLSAAPRRLAPCQGRLRQPGGRGAGGDPGARLGGVARLPSRLENRRLAGRR